MSDTYRRYAAIKQSLMQCYHPRPTGHRERHLNTLVALMCGLTGGQRAHLSTIADHAPSVRLHPARVEGGMDDPRQLQRP